MGIKFYDSNGKYWGEYDETRNLFIPSEETITQTETQNSNLNFEKDECAKEYEELGLKELKELIEADRKDEPSNSEKPNNCKVKNYCDDCLYTDTCDSKEFFYACTSKATISKMEQVETPIHGVFKSGELSDEDVKDLKRQVGLIIEYANKKEDEPKTDCAWR